MNLANFLAAMQLLWHHSQPVWDDYGSSLMLLPVHPLSLAWQHSTKAMLQVHTHSCQPCWLF